jgi:sialate O-acetylesterase
LLGRSPEEKILETMEFCKGHDRSAGPFRGKLMKIARLLLVSLATTSLVPHAAAALQLASVFGDHMVLQRDAPIPLWGNAEPGADVTIKVAGKSVTGRADAAGKFLLTLDPLSAGGPHELTVTTAGATVTIHDVLVGEVWVCSGQSNMEWPVSGAANAQAEIAGAVHPRLRLYTVPHAVADAPRTEVAGSWQVCSPTSISQFSAVGYYFGRELEQKLDVPVGLIHSSWGGTPAESWTTPQTLAAEPDYKPILDRWSAELAKGTQPNTNPWQPSSLYHGMIAPLLPLSIRGAIWYQGESNADRAYQYRKLFPAMISDWRRAFHHGDLPFLFVQLANFKPAASEPGESAWAELREAQSMTLALPHTGMSVTIDIGDEKDIHPKNKQEVGRRLALLALADVYGQKIEARGPTYDSMSVDRDQIRIRFKHADGLATQDGGAVQGFAIAGADHKFVWAQAEIEKDTIVVYCDDVHQPVAVRYAWGDNPKCNLINKAGLPASPFRTDDWPGSTRDAR